MFIIRFRSKILPKLLLLSTTYLKKNIIFKQGKKQTKVIDLLKQILTNFPALIFLDYIESTDDIIFAINISLDSNNFFKTFDNSYNQNAFVFFF